MTIHEGTAIEISHVDELELDDDESPPTDPSPSVETDHAKRVDNPEDDLEKRLAWLAAEVRSTSAIQAQKKRAESVLEAREYKTALVPSAKEPPKDVDLPKVSFAAGVDSHREPTQITKRPSTHEWEFDTSEPEELSRTLPLDPNAAIPDPLPFDAPKAPKPQGRNRGLIAMLGIAAGLLVGIVAFPRIQYSFYRDEHAAMPYIHRGLGEAAYVAASRYHEWLQDGELVRLLLPPTISSDSSTVAPESSADEVPAPTSYFPFMKSSASAPAKPPPSASVIVPKRSPTLRIYESSNGIAP